MRFLQWMYCPRISWTYFCLGIPCGLYLGYLWFYTSQPSVSCIVIHKSKSVDNINALKATWLGKCDHQIIVKYNRTQGRSPLLPAVVEECNAAPEVFNIRSESAWGALCQALLLTPRTSNWLLIVPDTAIVIMENLRKFIEGRDFKALVYAGHAVDSYLGPYNALSAGILLSSGTLRSLWQRFPSKESCETEGKFWNNEDVILGAQVNKFGARVEDTRDSQGRGRFHGFNVNTLLNAGPLFRRMDYFKKATFPVKPGMDCCSNDLISIGTTDADHTLWQYFLTYRIGSIERTNQTNKTESVSDASWVTALRDIGYEGSVDNMTSQQYYDIWMKHVPPEKIAAKLADIGST